MKSRITVEINFEKGNQPVIQVVGRNSINEPDVRDSLVQSFLQDFQGNSWAKIEFKLTDKDSGELSYHAVAVLSPIKSEDLLIESLRMKDQHDYINGIQPVKDPTPQFVSRFSIGDKADYTTKTWKMEAFTKARAKKENKDIEDDDLQYLPHYSYGKIVAVKFTEGKVYYDVLDDFSGKVVKELPSDNVKNLPAEYSSGQKVPQSPNKKS